MFILFDAMFYSSETVYMLWTNIRKQICDEKLNQIDGLATGEYSWLSGTAV